MFYTVLKIILARVMAEGWPCGFIPYPKPNTRGCVDGSGELTFGI